MSKEQLKRHEGDMTLENEVKRLLEIYQSLLNVIPPDKFNLKLNVSNNSETEIVIENISTDFRDPLVDFFKITIDEDGKLKIKKFFDFLSRELHEEIITKIEDVLEKYN